MTFLVGKVKCDACGKVVPNEEFFNKNTWYCSQKGDKITHLCPRCKRNFQKMWKKKKKRKGKKVKKILELHKKGLTDSQIAKELNTFPQYVYQTLIKYGVKKPKKKVKYDTGKLLEFLKLIFERPRLSNELPSARSYYFKELRKRGIPIRRIRLPFRFCRYIYFFDFQKNEVIDFLLKSDLKNKDIKRIVKVV